MLSLAGFMGLPKWAHGLMAVGALVVGFMVWLHFHDQSVKEADREASRIEALERDQKADASAQGVAAGKMEGVEVGNDAAAKAAADSDDPLKAGLDALK